MTIMRKGETHEQYMVRAYAERPAKMSEVVHLLEILTKSMDTQYNDLLDVTQKVAEDTARVVLELENRVVKLEEKHEDKQPTSGKENVEVPTCRSCKYFKEHTNFPLGFCDAGYTLSTKEAISYATNCDKFEKLEEKYKPLPKPKVDVWYCPCGYQNGGHICTKCGKPSSEGKNE